MIHTASTDAGRTAAAYASRGTGRQIARTQSAVTREGRTAETHNLQQRRDEKPPHTASSDSGMEESRNTASKSAKKEGLLQHSLQ